MNRVNSGNLYVVATPIGNLQDITFRAIEVLKSVSVIAAEDTRHSQRLLAHYTIQTPLISLHAFNEKEKTTALLNRLKQGETIALITDAGTPLISDPGSFLVRSACEFGVKVIPIPGCCAAVTALSASGLSAADFRFVGFLSSKGTQRQRQLQALRAESSTVVLYEAPHRIMSLMQDIVQTLGSERRVVLAKELTKLFETFVRGTAYEVERWLLASPDNQKGEFVVLIEGVEDEAHNAEIPPQTIETLKILCAELPVKQAVQLAVKITGANKNQLYRFASHLR